MGGFLQVSGLKYTIDTTVKSSAKGDDKSMFVSVDGAYRVKNVKVLKNGKYVDIDPKATYTVASHNYMLKDSGDGINMFADNKLLQDSVMLDNQVLINYIKDSLGGIVPQPMLLRRAASRSLPPRTPTCSTATGRLRLSTMSQTRTS